MTSVGSTPRHRAARSTVCLVCLSVLAALVGLSCNATTQSLDRTGDEDSLFISQETVRTIATIGLLESAQSDSTSTQFAGAPAYLVDLIVSDGLRELSGTMEVIYTHRHPLPVNEIAFHLHANGIGGQITVETASVDGDPATLRVSERGTVAWIGLEQDLHDGESTRIGLSFTAVVPTSNAVHYGILNTDRETASLAHLLPLIAVFDGQWRIDSPSDYGDVLFGDAGFYLVGLEIPAGVTVAGTGIETSQSTLPSGRIHVTLTAGPVRELYLALLTDSQVVTATAGDTVIRVYAPPQQAERAKLAGDLIASALASFGGWFGDYPFTELDVVVGPTRAVGMEFPGAILIGESTFFQSSLDPVSRVGGPSFFEIVLVHETAHQWFHTIVGNDQVNLPWLDESAVQFVTWQHAEARYGVSGDEAFEQWLQNTYLRGGMPEAPLGLPTSAYSTSSYASVIYGKGPLFYASIEDEYGEEAILAALRQYTSTFRWENGTTAGMRDALESSCGCSLGPWFEAWVYAN